MAILVNLLNLVIIKKSRDHKKSSDFDISDDQEKLGNSCYCGNFDEPCECGHSCETSYSDDSGESSDSNESCYVGESGDLIDKVILGFLLIS